MRFGSLRGRLPSLPRLRDQFLFKVKACFYRSIVKSLKFQKCIIKSSYTFKIVFRTIYFIIYEQILFLKEFFLSPGHDRVVTIKSRNFLLQKFGVVLGLYWSMCCNLAAHSSIHASFLLRRGLTRFQLPKGFLGLRIVECRNSSDYCNEARVPYRQATSHSLLPIMCKPKYL